MLLFKKKKNIKKNKNFYSYFFYYFGIFSFFITILVTLHSIPFFKFAINKLVFKDNIDTLKFFETVSREISYKIIGPSYFSVNTPKKSLDFLKIFFSENLKKNNIDKIKLDINYENLELLENQRLRKLTPSKWAKADVTYFSEDTKNKKIKIKLRAKGDRAIHRRNLKNMSFKIDIIGDDRIYGLEEFSLQKPIVRNYSLEIIASQLMLLNNIVAPKTKLINLYINGENRGFYHLEEGFSKEILELNNRKNGPIFGIEDDYSVIFPNINFDLYSEPYWIKNNPDLINIARSKLEFIKNNYDKINFDIFLYFDSEKWATFFALTDILAAHHGAKIDSVKFFYNPSIEKFEPIFFDGHINLGTSKINIMLSDFMNLNEDLKDEMGYLQNYESWFKLFFNKSDSNSKFLKSYYQELIRFTENEFQLQTEEVFSNIEPYNRKYYSKFMLADGIASASILPFYFDKNFFKERSLFVRKKLPTLKTNINQYASDPHDINYYKFNDNELFLENFLDLDKKTYFIKNINLSQKKINFKNPSVLYMEGNNIIDKTIISGPVMIVQKKGKIEIKDSIFKGLVNNEIKSTNWSGSINIINSSVKIKNILIKDSNAEDAINLVNSYGVLKNLKVENSSSDAIDIDFGNFEFENISCKNIKNDCLDVSGSTIKGKKLYGYEVLDKVLSSGEKSFVNINNVEILNSEIGLVSKDTSHVLINKAIFSNTKLHGAVFKKKQMFEGKTSLEILNHSKVLEDNLHEKFLVSLDSQLKINNKILPSNYSSKEIENKMYGNEYGN